MTRGLDIDVAARGDRPFADLADFAARVDPRQLNKMQLENLARAGAFDSIEPNRARLFTGTETILRRAQAQAEETASGQIGLFGEAGKVGTAAPAGDARLADDGTIGVRGRGRRLPPQRAPTGRLCPGAAPPRRNPLRAGRGAGTRRRHARAHRRQRRRHQGTHDAHRQTHGLGPHLRRLRLHRGDAVRRDTGDRARPDRQRNERAGDRGIGVPGRGFPHHRAGRGAARSGRHQRGRRHAHLAAGNRGRAAHPRPARSRGQGEGPRLPGAAAGGGTIGGDRVAGRLQRLAQAGAGDEDPAGRGTGRGTVSSNSPSP